MRSATFRFTSSESASKFKCKLDGGPWRPCGSPKTYSGLSKGSHTFRVYAIDSIGQHDPTPAKRTWRIR